MLLHASCASRDGPGLRVPPLRVQAEAGSRAKGGRQAEEAQGDVSDADLARRLGREDTTAKSMRMQKKARHK